MDESKEVPVPTTHSKEKGSITAKKDVRITVDTEDKGKEANIKKKVAKEKALDTKAGANQSSGPALELKDKPSGSSQLSPEQAL